MKKRHLHTYKRVRTRKNIYMCMHPDCTHFKAKEFLVNKRAECIICHNPFIMTPNLLRRASVRCEECVGTETPAKSEVSSMKQSLTDLLKERLTG
jgi:hypothetical protein